MPPLESKLSEDKRAEIVARYIDGATYVELSIDYGVAVSTIRKYVKAGGAKKPVRQRAAPATSMVEFKKRAKSILWRQESGNEKDRKSYHSWTKKVEDFEKGGMNAQQAIVQASKDFRCLFPLFRMYDVSGNDPLPGSHPEIHQLAPDGRQANVEVIECEGEDQSHRENLAWAIEAAGKQLRIGEQPEVAPNDAAYYLYCQARDEPRDFLGKFSQVHARGSDEQEGALLARESGKKSIEEINVMLQTLTEGEEQ